MRERIAFLRQTDLFSQVDEDLLERIAMGVEEVEVRAGETVFREGEAGDAIYLVVEGILNLVSEGVLLVGRGPGECVGEFALIDRESRSADAVAETDGRLLKWESADFHAALAQSPEIAYGVFRILTDKLRQDIAVQVEAARQLRRDNERLARENRQLQAQVGPEQDLVTRSRTMQEVLDLAWRVAASASTVLLRGESGTGKEVLARAIHRHSSYGEGPFVPVHCAALPATLLESELFGHEKGAFTGATGQRQGRFELANGGTLFLDEIGELEPEIQIKLLRVLQERTFERVGGHETVEVDVRVVAATHRDLEAFVRDGTFREDLYYRLNVVPVILPPLRERREDISVLVEHFLERFCLELGRSPLSIAPATMELLTAHAWPGNVRELQNLMERMAVVVDEETVQPAHLPLELRGVQSAAGERSATGLATLAEVERRHVEEALVRSAWNQSHAAQLLNISRDQLRLRIVRYGIKGPWRVGAPVRN